MIHFTEAARLQIIRALQNTEIPPNYSLRIGLSGGACSGKYIFGFDKPTEADQLFDIDGVRVIVRKAHLMYIIDKTVDFITEKGESVFVIF